MLCCGTVRQEGVDRCDSGKCVKHSMADCWCVVSLTVSPKMYSEVRNGTLIYHADSQPTKLTRTDELKNTVSVFVC